ncbi:MAG TPA: T9SS type A sorting domain-containing protein, partial [Bacteroidota bacterium]
RHCTGWGLNMGVNANDIATDAFTTIQTNYDRHAKAGIPRWDLPGTTSGGLWMETHSSRCLDNNSVLHPAINIIEGIYGREGPFVSGPSDNGGYGKDLMTNVIIFGKNARHVDLIGTYLAGHEPGNFGFFHLAVERGLSGYLNPHDVPLYEWKLDGSATVAALDDFARTPIRTLYLRKAGEEQYHMVNEPYDYSATSVVAGRPQTNPDVFALSQNFPNPFNPSTTIQYYLPKPGHATIELFNILGERLETLVDAAMAAGDHVVVWNGRSLPSGTYFVRLSYDGFSKVRKMALVH